MDLEEKKYITCTCEIKIQKANLGKRQATGSSGIFSSMTCWVAFWALCSEWISSPYLVIISELYLVFFFVLFCWFFFFEAMSLHNLFKFWEVFRFYSVPLISTTYLKKPVSAGTAHCFSSLTSLHLCVYELWGREIICKKMDS